MNKTIHAFACSVAAGIVLAACGSPGTAPKANEGDAQHGLSSLSSRPIYLRAMKTQLAMPRTPIGPLYTGTHCVPEGEVIWDDTLFRQVSHQLPKIFRREAQHAHYRVPPDSASGAGRPGSDTAQSHYIEVDLQVQEVRAGLCMQDEGTSGSTHVKVFWQVYAAGASAPLYETVTQGSHDAPLMEKRSAADFFADAFADALRDLLAQRGFREAVKQGVPEPRAIQ